MLYKNYKLFYKLQAIRYYLSFQGTVLKKLCAQEEHCYKQFNLVNEDPIKDFVPAYQGIITLEDDESKQILITYNYYPCLSSNKNGFIDS